jgi:hypothetical protein
MLYKDKVVHKYKKHLGKERICCERILKELSRGQYRSENILGQLSRSQIIKAKS